MLLKKEKPIFISLSIIILAALLFVILTLTKLSSSNTSTDISSQKGVLNLSNWDFHKEGYTSLSGQWGFYWNQLLTPEDFETNLTSTDYMEMPMAWNKYNKSYNSEGYATYSLTIKLNHKYKNFLLGISVPSMLSSYKLWVNGNLFSSNGTVGTSSSSELPYTLPITNYFMNNTDKVHLVLQVSNYNYRYGGTWDKMYLGTQSQIAEKKQASIALEIFYFSVLLIMGLYHLLLYGFRTENLSKLYFGALCTISSLRTLITGNRYLITMCNSINYITALKLEYISFYAATYFMVGYMYIVFKDNYSKRISNAFKLFCFLIIITTLFVSPLMCSKLLMVFQIFILVIIVYSVFIILKSYYIKRQSSLIVVIICLIAILLIAMAVLGYLGLNSPRDFLLPGFLLLILLNAFILAMNESKSYIKAINFSKEKEKYLLAEKLTQVTLLLNSTLNLQKVLDKLLESLKELVPYDSASFFMEENNLFKVKAANGFENMELINKISINKEDDQLFKDIYQTNAPLLIANVKSDARFKYNMGKSTLESWLGIPILYKTKIVGILTLDSSQKNIYTKYHCDIASYFAYHAGMAIENAKHHGETEKLARIDPLTNIYNRRSFFELANISFDKSKLLSQTISGIMMDIDDFKKINDNLGHSTGDLVLERLSKICSETLSEKHILGRFGGEEFIALLPETSFEEASIIGESLRSTIENNPIIIRKTDSIPITLSIGVASITPTIQDLDYLFVEADKSMYQAKSLGKNQVVAVNLDTLTVN